MEQILANIPSELKELKEGQTRLEKQVAENTEILKALEHDTQVN